MPFPGYTAAWPAQATFGGFVRIFPPRYSGERIVRQEPCRMCGSRDAVKISEVEFWDLQRSDLVLCSKCGHIQLDPMLTPKNTATGCLAYHFRELSQIALREQEWNLLRSFRRGIVFGHDLKSKGIRPSRVLEFGPGSGYFAAGLERCFPDAEITVADVVEDVLRRVRKIHGFKTIRATPETIRVPKVKFDLIIARDVMEHACDAAGMIANVKRLLVKGGIFHFTVPNGHEDAWSHYVRWKISERPSELLLNHVNYFNGSGLLSYLTRVGFKKLDYHTYDLKSTRRGKGWLVSGWRAAPVSVRRPAMKTIKELSVAASETNFNKSEVLDVWYLRTRARWLTALLCRMKHHWWIRLDPKLDIGHEIFGLFRKM